MPTNETPLRLFIEINGNDGKMYTWELNLFVVLLHKLYAILCIFISASGLIEENIESTNRFYSCRLRYKETLRNTSTKHLDRRISIFI